MADNRQYMALEWVIRDIKDTLAQAQRALDTYAREPDDVIQLKFCLTYIHQVYGSLHMSGFHGGAMIASEIEALAQGLLNKTVSHKKEAVEVLQKAIVELPVYLESALKTKSDQPSLVFSLLNDLRATRDASLMSECTVFSPNLDYAHQVRGEKHPITNNPQQLSLMIAKLRQMYQVAAASVIHKKNLEENFSYLSKVSQRLEKLLQGTARAALWEIVSAFIIGLQKNLIDDTASVKKLLRELDGELKELINGGAAALKKNTSDELIKNFLYYLSSLTETTSEIDALSERYALHKASPVRVELQSYGADSVESYAAITTSLLDSFDDIQGKIEICLQENDVFDHLDWLKMKLSQVADTLAMLNVTQLRQEITDSIAVVIDLQQDQSLFSEKMSSVHIRVSTVAKELEETLVNKQLPSEVTARQFSQEDDLTLQESRNGLEEAKDAVVNYIATQWNIKNLQPVPSILREVGEKLLQLSLAAPAEILSASANYIEMTMIHQSSQPEWKQLDSLADVITSIDYFLEVLSLTKEEDFSVLAGAENGLLSLGLPQHRVQNIMQGVASAAASQNTAQGDPVEKVTDNALELDEDTEAEIIAIFVEEAEEVQETIAEFLPSWESEFEDRDALTEVRRAFHTLKGSGRIVKAMDIGELSWSIENMLNRVMDNTLEPNKLQIGLIYKVLSILPGMVNAFSQRKTITNKATCEQYQLWAQALSKNEVPEDLRIYLDANDEHNSLEDTSQPLLTSNVSDADVPEIDAPETGVPEEDEIDVQLWEIFGSEAETHLIVIREYIIEMESARPFFEVPSDAMQRAMHTLKGSAHMAEITPIAELMTPMELFVKDLRAYQVVIDEDILQLIMDSVAYTESALEQIARLIYPTIEKLELFLARVAELRERSVGHLIKHEEEDGPKVDPAFLERLMNEGMNQLLDIDGVIGLWKKTPATDQEWRAVANEVANVQHGAERANLDSMAHLSAEIHKQYENLIAKKILPYDELYDVLLDSHYALLDIIDAIAGGQDLPPENEEILQQLDDLSVSHSALNETLNQDEAVLIEKVKNVESNEYLEAEESSEPLTVDAEPIQSADETDIVATKTDSVTAEADISLNSSLDDVNTNNDDIATHTSADHSLTEAPNAHEYTSPAVIDNEPVDVLSDELDDEIIEIFMEEAAELIEDLDATIDDWEGGEDSVVCNENIQRLLHTLKGGARLAGLMKLGELAHDFESYLVSQIKSESSDDVMNTVHQFQDQLIQGVNTFGESIELQRSPQQESSLSDEVVSEQTHDINEQNESPQEQTAETGESSNDALFTQVTEKEIIETEDLPHSAKTEYVTEKYEADKDNHQSSSEGSGDSGESDVNHTDVADHITDESNTESHPVSQNILSSINSEDSEPVTGVDDSLGDKTEIQVVDKAESEGLDDERVGAESLEAELQKSVSEQSEQDASNDKVLEKSDELAPDMPESEALISHELSAQEKDNKDNIVSFPSANLVPGSAVDSAADSDADVTKDTTAKAPTPLPQTPASSVVPQPSTARMASNGGAAASRRPAPQETVKVSADLMEELVNLAGETSISRGRMEEQMSDLGYSLEEMDQTVGRLQEQLRRLDIETEAQVVFRQEQLSEQEEFDPLEMDRYSQLQQLSRSLIESASDLKDLKQTLTNKARDAETVLLQQSRINTELQEGLMRSRMVPFSRIVPRLRRIVRQISSELNKEVTIEFDQTEGELDRNMMERMVAPLEHMLRNAVDHGIESAEQRQQIGKPKAGCITLSLSREGSNVLLLLTDDGAGMSVQRIKEKAIQQELMNPDAQLNDQEILQFIFQAGFSTAESVTQISGRGVGMDVVSSEIKQLGGSVDISSTEGQGTQFHIRLPFTVSVNRALMISMGDDRYAIPLNSIEGIARIAPDQLADYYSNTESRFHYAGTDYQLQYMGTLLNKEVAPKIKGHQLPVPVLLVRSADHSVAIQVDSLHGSQEIVVKTLGVQFSTVQGLSGATIMGDGNVVVILDANAMIRQQYALAATYQLSEPKEEQSVQAIVDRNPLVMVVDDSVTVRKVTTRFLERQGFDVITAKDGVHAIEVLRDQLPDLMLLDIEMPRMDGFEVARRVRATSTTTHLPIIMITSRTGEKHRETGLAAGANEYMGKPFQEDILLENIHHLLQIKH
jgi:chemosensory pili system protein ChpA (sensor histidine kinase/response regulator)